MEGNDHIICKIEMITTSETIYFAMFAIAKQTAAKTSVSVDS